MIINHNLPAMNAYRNLGMNNNAVSSSLQKLSSGLRINRAGDDAAGLAISEKMRSQIRGLDQATRNSQDGISLIQTAEGGLTETHAILQKMRQLAVQARNDTNTSEDRKALDTEYQQLSGEITNIANRTQFNTQKLLTGGAGSKLGDGTLTYTNPDGSSGTSAAVGASLTVAAGIAKIDISGAALNAVATGFTIAVDNGNHTMTLSRTAAGAANGNPAVVAASQTIDYTAAPTGFNTKTLNFDSFGIGITINSGLAGDIAATNTFQAIKGSLSFQSGANKSELTTVSIGNMQATAIGTGSVGSTTSTVTIASTDLTTAANVDTAMDSLDVAISQVSNQRAQLGAYQNRLEHTINNLGVSEENLTASESRIRDVDMAKEMMSYQKNNILAQAAQAMLAQANQAPQGVLRLLQ